MSRSLDPGSPERTAWGWWFWGLLVSLIGALSASREACFAILDDVCGLIEPLDETMCFGSVCDARLDVFHGVSPLVRIIPLDRLAIANHEKSEERRPETASDILRTAYWLGTECRTEICFEMCRASQRRNPSHVTMVGHSAQGLL